MGSMKSLLCLDVSENKIDRIPEELGNLASLTDLLVSQNLINALPESIGKHVHPVSSAHWRVFEANTSPERLFFFPCLQENYGNFLSWKLIRIGSLTFQRASVTVKALLSWCSQRTSCRCVWEHKPYYTHSCFRVGRWCIYLNVTET